MYVYIILMYLLVLLFYITVNHVILLLDTSMFYCAMTTKL